MSLLSAYAKAQMLRLVCYRGAKDSAYDLPTFWQRIFRSDIAPDLMRELYKHMGPRQFLDLKRYCLNDASFFRAKRCDEGWWKAMCKLFGVPTIELRDFVFTVNDTRRQYKEEWRYRFLGHAFRHFLQQISIPIMEPEGSSRDPSRVDAVACTPDKKTLILLMETRFEIYDLQSKVCKKDEARTLLLNTAAADLTSEYFSLCISPDGRFLFLGAVDTRIMRYELKSDRGVDVKFYETTLEYDDIWGNVCSHRPLCATNDAVYGVCASNGDSSVRGFVHADYLTEAAAANIFEPPFDGVDVLSVSVSGGDLHTQHLVAAYSDGIVLWNPKDSSNIVREELPSVRGQRILERRVEVEDSCMLSEYQYTSVRYEKIEIEEKSSLFVGSLLAIIDAKQILVLCLHDKIKLVPLSAITDTTMVLSTSTANVGVYRDVNFTFQNDILDVFACTDQNIVVWNIYFPLQHGDYPKQKNATSIIKTNRARARTWKRFITETQARRQEERVSLHAARKALGGDSDDEDSDENSDEDSEDPVEKSDEDSDDEYRPYSDDDDDDDYGGDGHISSFVPVLPRKDDFFKLVVCRTDMYYPHGVQVELPTLQLWSL